MPADSEYYFSQKSTSKLGHRIIPLTPNSLSANCINNPSFSTAGFPPLQKSIFTCDLTRLARPITKHAVVRHFDLLPPEHPWLLLGSGARSALQNN